MNLPEIAYSMGMSRARRKIPYNPQVCAALKKWEKLTGRKITIKVLPAPRDSVYGFTGWFDYENIYLGTSNLHTVFHELQHWQQQARGFNLREATLNYHKRFWYLHKSFTDNYSTQSSERDANIQANKMYKKIVGKTL